MIFRNRGCKDEKTSAKQKEKMPGDISYILLFSYGVGHVFNDLCASMWFTYVLIFLLYVIGFNDVLAGAALLIGQVADGIVTPIVGALSDKNYNFWLCNYGRRKSWHLLGTFCVLGSFPFIFSPCYGCQNTDHFYQLWYYSVFIIIFQFGWASVQISHLSLVPDLTPNQHGRTSLLAIRYTFTVFSNIIVYLITWFVFRLQNKESAVIGPDDKRKFQIVAYAVTILGTITSIIFNIGVRETSNSPEDSHQLIETSQSCMSLLRCKRVYKVACIYMATRLFVNLSQIYIPLYLQDYLKLPSESLAVLPLVMFASSFVTSIIIKPLNVEFGRRFAFVYGTILGLGACLWIQSGHDYYYRTYEIYGVVITFGCASSIMLVTSLGITADLIGTDTNNGAFIYGLMSFVDKISNGLVVMAIQYLKRADDSTLYYRNTILYSCGTAAFFGLLSVFAVQSENRSGDTLTTTVDDIKDNDSSETTAKEEPSPPIDTSVATMSAPISENI